MRYEPLRGLFHRWLTRVAATLILASATALHAAPQPPASQPPAPQQGAPGTRGAGQASPSSPVIARIDGEPVTVAMYSRYLLMTEGLGKLNEFIDRLLLQREAKKLQISLPYDAVDRQVEARIAKLKSIFGDDHDELVKALKKRQVSVPDFRRWLTQKLLWDMVLDECIEKTRTFDAEDLKKAYAEWYPDSVELELRHIFLKDREAENVVMRARSLLDRVEKGESFAELARRYSEDPETADSGGVIAHYHRGIYGDAFDRAVLTLTKDDPFILVRGKNGWHIVELLDRRPIQFQDMRPTILAELKKKPPTDEEKAKFFERLRKEAKIVHVDAGDAIDALFENPTSQ